MTPVNGQTAPVNGQTAPVNRQETPTATNLSAEYT
jgi:hypothetical protein